MRVRCAFIALLPVLVGCATSGSYPPVASRPITDDVGWSAAQVQPLPETRPVSRPAVRKASAFEQLHRFEEGQSYVVKVGVKYPVLVKLEAGEKVFDVVWGDRSPIAPGEEGSPWDVKEGNSGSHTDPSRVVMIGATRPGLSQGLTMTTNRRIYLLDVRSVPTSKLRLVRWSYDDETLVRTVAPKPSLLPDPLHPRKYYGGYLIEAVAPAGASAPPTWMPRQVLHDLQGNTYIVFPPYLTAVSSPLLRLVTSSGPELVNYQQVGTTYVLHGIVNMAELRVGNGETAEIVRITRQDPVEIACPGQEMCPQWGSAHVASQR